MSSREALIFTANPRSCHKTSHVVINHFVNMPKWKISKLEFSLWWLCAAFIFLFAILQSYELVACVLDLIIFDKDLDHAVGPGCFFFFFWNDCADLKKKEKKLGKYLLPNICKEHITLPHYPTGLLFLSPECSAHNSCDWCTEKKKSCIYLTLPWMIIGASTPFYSADKALGEITLAVQDQEISSFFFNKNH